MRRTAAAPAPAPTVLVVEDQALVAMLVADTLAEAGYGSTWTPDGGFGPPAEALEAAVVDLGLADGLDGRDVIRRLRARRAALPVLVVTGYDAQAPEADLRGLGGPMARLHKPFDCDGLALRLADVLGAPTDPGVRRRASDVLKPAA